MSDVIPAKLTLRISCGLRGRIFINCNEYKGLLVGGKTLEEALINVVPAIKDLLSVDPNIPAFQGIEL